MMPISITAPIRALRPGLAKKATMICLYSTTITSAQSTRNTSIRTRKIRGEDSLVSSISIAARGEGFWGIGLTSSMAKARSTANMARKRGEKRSEGPLLNQTKGELEVETAHYLPAYFSNVRCLVGRYRVFAWR